MDDADATRDEMPALELAARRAATAQRPGLRPLVVSAAQAADYLSISRGLFNAQVRPHLRDIHIGPRVVRFALEQIDEFVERVKAGIPHPTQQPSGRNFRCRKNSNARRDSSSEEATGTSTRSYSVGDFVKLRARLTALRRRCT